MSSVDKLPYQGLCSPHLILPYFLCPQNHGEEYRNLRLSDYSHSLYASFLKIPLAYSRKDFKTGEHLLGPRHVYNQLSFHQWLVFRHFTTKAVWPGQERASLPCSDRTSRGPQGSPSSCSVIWCLAVQDDGLYYKKGLSPLVTSHPWNNHIFPFLKDVVGSVSKEFKGLEEE